MNHSFSNGESQDERLAASKGFAAALPRYLRCGTRIRRVIEDLVQVFNDLTLVADERERALRALAATLFAETGEMAEHSEASPPLPDAPDQARWRKRLQEQEEVFVANLKRLMEDRGLTQAELAERAGLSQPAISMMLARRYRPQRRTIRLLAQVLGVSESELAPEQAPAESGRSANGIGSTATGRTATADQVPPANVD